MVRVLKVLGCLWIALLLVACVHRGPDPFEAGPFHESPVEQEVLDSIKRFRNGLGEARTLTGLAKGVAEEGRKKRPFKQVFALEPPDRIRIEVQSSIGQTVALFVCNGSNLFFDQNGRGSPWFGNSDSEGVRQSLGYAISVKELIGVLMARFPPLEQKAGDLIGQNEEQVVLSFSRGGEGKVQFVFDRRTGVLRSSTFWDSQQIRQVAVLYDEFTLVDGVVLPAHMRIRSFNERQTVDWTLLKARVNPELKPVAFRFPDPLPVH